MIWRVWADYYGKFAPCGPTLLSKDSRDYLETSDYIWRFKSRSAQTIEMQPINKSKFKPAKHNSVYNEYSERESTGFWKHILTCIDMPRANIASGEWEKRLTRRYVWICISNNCLILSGQWTNWNRNLSLANLPKTNCSNTGYTDWANKDEAPSKESQKITKSSIPAVYQW